MPALCPVGVRFLVSPAVFCELTSAPHHRCGMRGVMFVGSGIAKCGPFRAQSVPMRLPEL